MPPSDCPPLTHGVVVPPSDYLPPTQGVVVPPSDCRPPPRVPRCYPEELLCGRLANLSTKLECVQASARSVIDYLNEKTGSNLSLKEVIRADEQLVAGLLHFLIIKSSEDQIYKAKVYCDLRGNRFVKEVNHVMIRNEGGDGDGNVAVKDDAVKDGDSRNADIRGKDDARCVNIGMKVPPSNGPSVPPGVRMSRIMHPRDIKSDEVIVLPLRPDDERVQDSARFALACMNHHMGTDLTLVKIVRAKMQLMAGTHFFFTMKASDNRLYKAKVDINRYQKRSLGYMKLIVPSKTRDNDSHIVEKDGDSQNADDAGKHGDIHNADDAVKNGKDGDYHIANDAGKDGNSHGADDVGEDMIDAVQMMHGEGLSKDDDA